MERYDRLMNDVEGKTSAGMIRWVDARKDPLPDIVPNTRRMIRAFRAPYDLAQRQYALLFVEWKTWYDDGYGGETEGRDRRLYVLDAAGDVVLEIDDRLADAHDLARLGATIVETSDRTKEFFAALDASGAA